MRRIIAVAAAAGVLATALPARAAGVRLSDIDGHWARPQIEAAVAMGYVNGFPDGTFGPYKPVTRAEFFKMLGGALRLTPTQGQTGLPDENASPRNWSFIHGHVQAAVSAGLLYPPDYSTGFGPETRITRREIVVAAVRALGKEPVVHAYDRTLSAPDAANYQQWERNYAAVAMSEGIITGFPDGTVGLSMVASRSEALVMIQRILAKVTRTPEAYSGPTGPETARHPGEGEPYWSWSGGKVTQASAVVHVLPGGAAAADLLPAPGKAAWVRYVTADGTGVLGLAARGQWTEVARYPGKRPELLAVDDSGALWFTDGGTRLMQVSPGEEPEAVPEVAERISFGEVDWNGTFWAMSENRLYRISAAGQVMPYDSGVPASQVQHFTVGEDGSVWVITTGTAPQAVKLEYGAVKKRIPVPSRYFGGLNADRRATVVGRSGPFLWLTAAAAGQTELAAGVYRLDLTIGEFVRVVVDRRIADGYAVLPAPDGGTLIRDADGAFWRMLP